MAPAVGASPPPGREVMMGAVSLLAIPAAFCGFGVVLFGLFARR
jgi:hypothetical protein